MAPAKPRPVSARFPEIRCSPEQLAEVKRRAGAAKQTVSEYVRRKALGGKRPA